jgi:hypothetical protein
VENVENVAVRLLSDAVLVADVGADDASWVAGNSSRVVVVLAMSALRQRLDNYMAEKSNDRMGQEHIGERTS